MIKIVSFISEAEEATMNFILVAGPQQVYKLRNIVTRVGQGVRCDIKIMDHRISDHHASFVYKSNYSLALINHSNSRYVRVNGETVFTHRILQENDKISFPGAIRMELVKECNYQMTIPKEEEAPTDAEEEERMEVNNITSETELLNYNVPTRRELYIQLHPTFTKEMIDVMMKDCCVELERFTEIVEEPEISEATEPLNYTVPTRYDFYQRLYPRFTEEMLDVLLLAFDDDQFIQEEFFTLAWFGRRDFQSARAYKQWIKYYLERVQLTPD